MFFKVASPQKGTHTLSGKKKKLQEDSIVDSWLSISSSSRTRLLRQRLYSSVSLESSQFSTTLGSVVSACVVEDDISQQKINPKGFSVPHHSFCLYNIGKSYVMISWSNKLLLYGRFYHIFQIMFSKHKFQTHFKNFHGDLWKISPSWSRL